MPRWTRDAITHMSLPNPRHHPQAHVVPESVRGVGGCVSREERPDEREERPDEREESPDERFFVSANLWLPFF